MLDQFLSNTTHIISISLQSSFGESHTGRLASWKALREFIAHCGINQRVEEREKEREIEGERVR